ncbi:MAG: hypothetical protein LBN33_01670 [Desulfovibrio sp.]|jgi:hypothetical protein|nr:hypothetical protein [Desulfovibrio sp.]
MKILLSRLLPLLRFSSGAIALVPVLAFLSGCATGAVDRLLPHLDTLSVAVSYFGEPQSGTKTVEGPSRYEWLLDDVTTVPGQYVTVRILMGSDRHGFPVYYEYTEWVPEHLEKRYCRLNITVGPEGRILDFSSEGDHCDSLLKRPSTYQ